MCVYALFLSLSLSLSALSQLRKEHLAISMCAYLCHFFRCFGQLSRRERRKNSSNIPMTDPTGAGIYGVPWIPSICPSHVSIFLPAPAGSYGIICLTWAGMIGMKHSLKLVY